MEFIGKTIKGTESEPGYVFIAEDSAPVDMPGIYGLYDLLEYEAAEEARDIVYDSGLSSDADSIAIEFLLDDHSREDYGIDDLFSELAVLNGEEPRKVEYDDAEKLVELAKERILQELDLAKFALKVVSPEKLEDAEEYFDTNILEHGGINKEMLIDKIAQLLLDKIAYKYKEELSQIWFDYKDYGKDTSLALAKDRAFRGNFYLARTIHSTGRLTDSEFKKLIDDGIVQLPKEMPNKVQII